MLNRLIAILFFVQNGFLSFAQPANDNCASASTLVSGAAPTCSQTTDNATTQAGEVTATGSTGASATFSETVWYKFVATATSMYVEWEYTGLVAGATWCPTKLSMVVYNTATCVPAAGSILAAESSASDGAIVINLTGLTIGNTYLVQVGYDGGSGCQEPLFCMAVGNTPTSCSCASPCASGCGYAATPSVATVTSTCPEYVLSPIVDGGETNTYCYTFIAASTTVSFSMIITSNCGSGNVSALTWTLQTSSCGATVASGTLSGMSATTVVGQTYVLCYTYTVPTTCHHSSLYPYFVGASPLSVELLSFTGKKYKGNQAMLNWSTASESNNDYFTLERSYDGNSYEVIGTISGAGNSNEIKNYSILDKKPQIGVNYYRLRQTDYDGNGSYSRIQAIQFEELNPFAVELVPNPAGSENITVNITGSSNQEVELFFYDISGSIAHKLKCQTDANGYANLSINNILKTGYYLVRITSGDEFNTQKLIVN